MAEKGHSTHVTRDHAGISNLPREPRGGRTQEMLSPCEISRRTVSHEPDQVQLLSGSREASGAPQPLPQQPRSSSTGHASRVRGVILKAVRHPNMEICKAVPIGKMWVKEMIAGSFS